MSSNRGEGFCRSAAQGRRQRDSDLHVLIKRSGGKESLFLPGRMQACLEREVLGVFVWLRGSPGDGRGEKHRMKRLFSQQVLSASPGSVVTERHEEGMCSYAGDSKACTALIPLAYSKRWLGGKTDVAFVLGLL